MGKKLASLSIVLVLLLAAATFLWFKGKPHTPSVNPLGPVDPTSIHTISIETAQSSMTFRNEGGAWQLSRPIEDDADPTVMDRLITALKAFTLGSIVSDNPENYSRFEIEDAKATHLLVYAKGNEKPILDGFVGKSAANFGDSFFRLSNKKEVYVANGLPSYIFKRELREYRLAKVFKKSLSQADGIEIKTPKQNWSFSRSSSTWTMTSAKSDTASVDIQRFLSEMDRWVPMEYGGPSDNNSLPSLSKVIFAMTSHYGDGVTELIIRDDLIGDGSGDKSRDRRSITISDRKYSMLIPAKLVTEVLDQLKKIK